MPLSMIKSKITIATLDDSTDIDFISLVSRLELSISYRIYDLSDGANIVNNQCINNLCVNILSKNN